jgi:transcriptional regulator with XRE-family HTH domain
MRTRRFPAVVRRGSVDEQVLLRRLRQARRDAGLTQVDVAGRLGRSQSFVTKVETGERRLDVVELRAFARLYRKPVSYFFGE